MKPQLIDNSIEAHVVYASISYAMNFMNRAEAIRTITDNTHYNEGSAKIGLTMWRNFTQKTHKRTFKATEIKYYLEYAKQYGVLDECKAGIQRSIDYLDLSAKHTAELK